jgi:uncharacterized protein YceH (UPF0502 family)
MAPASAQDRAGVLATSDQERTRVSKLTRGPGKRADKMEGLFAGMVMADPARAFAFAPTGRPLHVRCPRCSSQFSGVILATLRHKALLR